VNPALVMPFYPCDVVLRQSAFYNFVCYHDYVFTRLAATTHVTKQMMMRKAGSVQRLVLVGSSVDKEARSPFTKSRNLSLPLPILVSPLDFDSFADLSPTVRPFIARLPIGARYGR
jgi:hypothetical protein